MSRLGTDETVLGQQFVAVVYDGEMGPGKPFIGTDDFPDGLLRIFLQEESWMRGDARIIDLPDLRYGRAKQQTGQQDEQGSFHRMCRK